MLVPPTTKTGTTSRKTRAIPNYTTIPSDYLLTIDRDCLYVKCIYALRAECERYNSRFKDFTLDRLSVRNSSNAANLNILAHIATLGVVSAAILDKNLFAVSSFANSWLDSFRIFPSLIFISNANQVLK